VRFKTVPARKTPKAMAEMLELWQRGMKEKWLTPLALAAALNLDFLCIPVSRRQWPRLAAALSARVLSLRHRSRTLHQPGTPHRAEQGAILRSAGGKFPTLAWQQTRSVAGNEFPAVHPRAGVQ
jgi:hypothetical protein